MKNMIYYRQVGSERLQCIARDSSTRQSDIKTGWSPGSDNIGLTIKKQLLDTTIVVLLKSTNLRHTCNCLKSITSCNPGCHIVVVFDERQIEVAAKTRYVAVVDNRVEVYSGWIEHLLMSLLVSKYHKISAIPTSQFVLPFGIDLDYVQRGICGITTLKKTRSTDSMCCVFDRSNRHLGHGADCGVLVRFDGQEILDIDVESLCVEILNLEPDKTDRPKVVFVFREMVVCGAVLLAVHVCNGLRRYGYDAFTACTRLDPGHSKKLPFDFCPFVVDGTDKALRIALSKIVGRGDIVIAPLFMSVNDVAEICRLSGATPIYYVQDDERLFTFPNGEFYNESIDVEQSYKTIDTIVSNSIWVKDELKKLGHKSKVIMPGVDCLEYTDRHVDDGIIRVMAHCRPSTPRRGWSFLVKVLNAISKHRDVEIITYDEDPIDLWVSRHRHLGRVLPSELAIEMSRVDIFIEGSDIQGFGMQALEAMACGCALVCRPNRGIDTFGTHQHDCMIVDDEQGAVEMVLALIDSKMTRKTLGRNAQNTALGLDWKYAVNAWIKLIGDCHA